MNPLAWETQLAGEEGFGSVFHGVKLDSLFHLVPERGFSSGAKRLSALRVTSAVFRTVFFN